MDTKKISYGGWPNCYRLADGSIELIVTADVGPRIIRFGFVGGENMFCEFRDQLGQTGGNEWRPYGGHRLWHAPEEMPRTYFPDNAPVKVEQHDDFVRFIQPVETTTGIQKEMDVSLSKIVHRLRNTGRAPVELAPWVLTVMAPGGVAIVPLPPRGSHPEDLPPGNTLTLWKYTDLSDPRWTWGRKYILLRQDSSPGVTPQKLGASVPDGWAAYALNGQLFVKQFPHLAGANYADWGCNFETFTNRDMLEVETLGTLASIQPGRAVEHTERWSLFRDVPVPHNDADVDTHVLPKLAPRQ